MKAEIISVGTELLLGDVVNTNAAYLSKECALLGIDVFHQCVIGDNPKRLEDVLSESLKRSDCLILTGGLGPTYDDLTKETVAKHFGKGLVLNHQELSKIQAFFDKINHEMQDNNRKQAMIIEGASPLYNARGTAPGIYLEEGEKIVILLPGPPAEMRYMFEHEVKPLLIAKQEMPLFSTNVHIFGMGESEVESRLYQIMTTSLNPTVAPYAKTGEVELRISAKARNQEEAEIYLQPMIKQVREALGDVIYGIDVDSLQDACLQACFKSQTTLSVVDTMGGSFAQRLADIDVEHAVMKANINIYNYHDLSQQFDLYQTEENWVNDEDALRIARTVKNQFGTTIGICILGIDRYGLAQPFGFAKIALVSPWEEKIVDINLQRSYSDSQPYVHYMSASHSFAQILHLLKTRSKSIF